MSSAAEMGVRRLLARAITHCSILKRPPLPVPRVTVCLRHRQSLPHRRVHLSTTSAAPHVFSGSDLPPSLTWGSEWSNSDRTGERRTSDIAMALGAGLLLCATGSGRDEERRFLLAAKKSDRDSMQSLLQSGVDINCRHPLGWTALHTAVINRQHRAVELLVGMGADVNAEDEFSSASRMASRLRTTPGRVAEVRDLEFSARINHFVSYSGFTPLHYAVISDDVGMVQLLMKHGADPTVENSQGLAPIDYCTNEQIKALLQEYTTKVEAERLRARLEERRQFPLEERLRERIVGQEGPIATVSAAIRRRELGWADDDHPLVFLFLGSSGIGKTELGKQIAHYMHKDNPKGFIRLDMSEYQEKHEVAKLIGSPPGYVGYDQGGQLTERLRECPGAVVLFDEVDKAHPDVLTTLLQLFDEGRLTDGRGQTIHCKEAIFVMTSNLASNEIASHALQLRREAAQAVRDYHHKTEPEEHIEISRDFKEKVVEPILKHHFRRDEFLGRINEMVYFLPFSRSELHQLVEKELRTWQTRAEKRHTIHLTWDREVLDLLADGYNVKYGARSIQHEVDRRVVNQLASAFEQGLLTKDSAVRLVVGGVGEGEGVTIKLVVTEKSGRDHEVNVGHISYLLDNSEPLF